MIRPSKLCYQRILYYNLPVSFALLFLIFVCIFSYPQKKRGGIFRDYFQRLTPPPHQPPANSLVRSRLVFLLESMGRICVCIRSSNPLTYAPSSTVTSPLRFWRPTSQHFWETPPGNLAQLSHTSILRHRCSTSLADRVLHIHIHQNKTLSLRQ